MSELLSAADRGPTLGDAELRRVTGYRRPSEQLRELHAQGFYRARRGSDGSVILERPHFEAVCAGRERPKADTPRVRLLAKAAA